MTGRRNGCVILTKKSFNFAGKRGFEIWRFKSPALGQEPREASAGLLGVLYGGCGAGNVCVCVCARSTTASQNGLKKHLTPTISNSYFLFVFK